MSRILLFIPLLAACTTTAALQPPEGDKVVERMSVWFGECWGLCIQEVSFGDEHTLELVGKNWDDTEYGHATGTLTEDGIAELHAIEADLADVELDAVYGCPDCADGGGVTVTRWDDRGQVSSDYPYGDPPEPLIDLDALFFDLVDALIVCDDSDLVTAEPGCQPVVTPQ